MKKLRITIGNETYDVTVEVLEETPPRPVAPGVVASSMAAPAVSAPPAIRPAPSAPLGNGSVCSPMPGTVTVVHVNVGDRVDAGHVLLILDAMKMENKIMAPKPGTVKSVQIKPGDAVSEGQILCVVE